MAKKIFAAILLMVLCARPGIPAGTPPPPQLADPGKVPEGTAELMPVENPSPTPIVTPILIPGGTSKTGTGRGTVPDPNGYILVPLKPNLSPNELNRLMLSLSKMGPVRNLGKSNMELVVHAVNGMTAEEAAQNANLDPAVNADLPYRTDPSQKMPMWVKALPNMTPGTTPSTPGPSKALLPAGGIWVKLNPGVSDQKILEFFDHVGLIEEIRLTTDNGKICLVHISIGLKMEDVMKKIKKSKIVQYVDPNAVHTKNDFEGKVD